MASIIHPLLTLLASVSRQPLLQQIAYLLAENRTLRSKLPDRISLSNQERRKLIRQGKKLGARIKDLISIVSYTTFRKWVRTMEDTNPKRPKSKTGKKGRPRIEESLSDTIIRIRKETNMGYTKIIHLGSRRIWISPSTYKPSGEWTSQQARNFQMHIDETGLKCGILCRDNDTKYVKDFDAIFTSSNCKIKRITPRSPNLQAHVERVNQTLKHEVLNAFCIESNRHMDHILRTAMHWYNERRGHSARDHLPPVRDSHPILLAGFPEGNIVCDSELGGHL